MGTYACSYGVLRIKHFPCSSCQKREGPCYAAVFTWSHAKIKVQSLKWEFPPGQQCSFHALSTLAASILNGDESLWTCLIAGVPTGIYKHSPLNIIFVVGSTGPKLRRTQMFIAAWSGLNARHRALAKHGSSAILSSSGHAARSGCRATVFLGDARIAREMRSLSCVRCWNLGRRLRLSSSAQMCFLPATWVRARQPLVREDHAATVLRKPLKVMPDSSEMLSDADGNTKRKCLVRMRAAAVMARARCTKVSKHAL